jgi:beta-ureidopropionase / N-carbamoyl-L-amino-acid hydrolase
MTFADLWETLKPIGRTSCGYRRYSWTQSDAECREWFQQQASSRGLAVETDRNGNLWAWWGDTRAESGSPDPGQRGAIVTGSHLDSVPDGGAFDGPLGIVSALAAIDLLEQRGVTPVRPVAVTAFIEEEGARFGLACLGSKLLTGAVTPDQARALTDADGITYAEAMAAAGLDPAAIGPDPDRVASIQSFIELHIEQGRSLADAPPPAPAPAPSPVPMATRGTRTPSGGGSCATGSLAGGAGWAVGVAEGIWPHGRWRIDFAGMADHAGTARLADRRDPMLPFAATVLAARKAAAERGALATFGKVIAEPGGVNGVSAAVHAWLDARAADEETLLDTVTTVRSECLRVSQEHGVTVSIRQESATPEVLFDRALRDRINAVLGGVPVLPTGAGHDAGVLAARVPTAMLFVRNPTGVSHSPAEHADLADCEAGVRALAAVLEELACR